MNLSKSHASTRRRFLPASGSGNGTTSCQRNPAGRNYARKASFLIWSALIIGWASKTVSAATFYSSRAAWITALGFTPGVDDIESDTTNPNYPSPYTTASGGWKLTQSIPANYPISVYAGGIINGSQELHFRDFSAGVVVNLPSPSSYGGFDYALGFEPWTLDVGGDLQILPNNTTGFMGFIDNVPRASFLLTGATGPQGGISMDNLSPASVPEPAGVLLLALGGVCTLCYVRPKRRQSDCSAQHSTPQYFPRGLSTAPLTVSAGIGVFAGDLLGLHGYLTNPGYRYRSIAAPSPTSLPNVDGIAPRFLSATGATETVNTIPTSRFVAGSFTLGNNSIAATTEDGKTGPLGASILEVSWRETYELTGWLFAGPTYKLGGAFGVDVDLRLDAPFPGAAVAILTTQMVVNGNLYDGTRRRRMESSGVPYPSGLSIIDKGSCVVENQTSHRILNE